MNQQHEYIGTRKLLIGIVLAVITFWLFANSLINVIPNLQTSFGSYLSTISIAVSLTALFCGMFVVGAGSLADYFGRVRLTIIGLWLNIFGSLLIIVSDYIPLLLMGRAIQGLSAALIMPATLSLIKAYYHGDKRQRALSLWSIGSWGGSGFASLFGGMIATFLSWRWIFVFSIIVPLIAVLLIKGTPESKNQHASSRQFDIVGLILLVVMMLSLNIMITQAAHLGLFSVAIVSLFVAFVLSTILFIILENRKRYPLIDFALFRNRFYTSATFANFLINTVAGTLLITNTFVQQGIGLSSFETGLLSLTYLFAVLTMIRVGEKILQEFGSRKPMLIGTMSTTVGIFLMSITFLPIPVYITLCVIGFLLFGLGLGLFATPSTDTAISHSPEEKVGVASGIYKMASSIGGAFGVAISGSIYSIFSTLFDPKLGAMMGLWFNTMIAFTAYFIVWLTLPNTKKNS